MRSVEIEALLFNETKLIDLVSTNNKLHCHQTDGIEILRRALEAKGCKVEAAVCETVATPRRSIDAIELCRPKMKEIGSIIGRGWDRLFNAVPLDAVLIVSHPDGINFVSLCLGDYYIALYLPGLLLVRFCEKGTREDFESSFKQACLASLIISEGHARLVATGNSAEQINNLATPFEILSTRLNLLILNHCRKEFEDRQFTVELIYRLVSRLLGVEPQFGFRSFNCMRFNRADFPQIFPRAVIPLEQPDVEPPHPDVWVGLSNAEVSSIFRAWREEKIRKEEQEMDEPFIFKSRDDDNNLFSQQKSFFHDAAALQQAQQDTDRRNPPKKDH